MIAHAPFATPPQSILLVRALPGIGDLLCAGPAWRALRRAYPRAHIALLGLGSVAPILEHMPGLVDEVIAFVGWPGITESPDLDPARVQAGIAAVRARCFDLVVQHHGDGSSSNGLVAAIARRHRAGFAPSPARATRWFPPYPFDLPEIRRHLALARLLGATTTADDEQVPFAVSADARRGADALLRRHGAGPNYAVLHLGATDLRRRWAVEQFARVAAGLHDRALGVVVIGTAADASLAASLRASVPSVVDLTGQTSLGEMGAVIASARVMVTNDSGPSHVAAALSTPSVVLFRPEERARWAPLDTQRHLALDLSSTPAQVLASVDALLGTAQLCSA